MITKIEKPVDLPNGELQMIQVDDEAEAQQIAGERTAYLFKSHIIDALYLFIPAPAGAERS